MTEEAPRYDTPQEMSTEELARRLRVQFKSLPAGEVTRTLHLFGIQYAESIGNRATAIAREAFGSEKACRGIVIRDGMNLARSVTLRSDS